MQEKSKKSNHLTKMDVSLVRLMSLFLVSMVIAWSVLVFVNSFIFCINLYCISGGRIDFYEQNGSQSAPITAIALQEPLSNAEQQGSWKVKQHQEGALNIAVAPVGKKPEEADEVVENLLRIIRSGRSLKGSDYNANGLCDGRGIFVYDLPEKFNKEFVVKCEEPKQWPDFCILLDNDFMGQPMPSIGEHCYRTDQFMLEPMFHLRIMTHPCRVSDYKDAKLFYVPFYAGFSLMKHDLLAIKEHNLLNVSINLPQDALGMELIDWLQMQSPWQHNNGKDHFFVLGKVSWEFRRYSPVDWGSNFLLHEAMQAPYKLTIERNYYDATDISVPYPTYFHPHDDADITSWQFRINSTERKYLVSFAGAGREGTVRSVLLEQCKSNTEYCRILDCSVGNCLKSETLVELFMMSDFCMQPRGDSATRKSFFDSLVSGCIPVVFSLDSAYYQYPWHLPEDLQKYSVFIDEKQVMKGNVNIVERLKGISIAEKEEMKRYIVQELMPGLVYGDSTAKFDKFRDAFDIVVDSLLSKATSL